jgi:hypothetical protein
VGLDDLLEPLNEVEQVGRFVVAVSGVDRDPASSQAILRLPAGTVLLLDAVGIEDPLPLLETVGHGQAARSVAACAGLPSFVAARIATNCRCHSMMASCNRLGFSEGWVSRDDASIVTSSQVACASGAERLRLRYSKLKLARSRWLRLNSSASPVG